MVSVIILAAGESSRMRRQKLLLPVGAKTMLERAVANYLASEAGEVIIVVGSGADECTRLVSKQPVKIVLNPNYRNGMSTSIIAGLGAVSNKSEGVMIALADQPFVDAETINHLIRVFARHEKGIVVPFYGGRRGNPVIFALKYRGELLQLQGDTGARNLLVQHPEDVLRVEVGCEGVLLDIDTPREYNKQLHQHQNGR